MWRDSKFGYGLISILFHWVGAALIIAIWLIGNEIDDAQRGPARLAVQNLHYGVAVLAMIVLLPRLIWRFANFKTPLVETSAPLLDLAAKIVKWGLLAAIVVMLITGPLDVWSGKRAAIDVFGFIIPSPLPSSVSAIIHGPVGGIHKVTSKIILALVALHVLGALKHLVIDRDGVVMRMLRPVNSSN